MFLRELILVESGELVSNTWAICPRVWNNPPNGGLIPHIALISHVILMKEGLFYPLTLG